MSSSIVTESKTKTKTTTPPRRDWREMKNKRNKFLETNLDNVQSSTTTMTASSSSTVNSEPIVQNSTNNGNATATAAVVSPPKSLAISVETSEFSELKIMRTSTRSARGPGSIAILNASSPLLHSPKTLQHNNGNGHHHTHNIINDHQQQSYSVSSSVVSTPEQRDRSLSSSSFSNDNQPMTPPPTFASATSYSSIIPPPIPVPSPVSASVFISNADPSSTSPVKTTIVPIITSPLLSSSKDSSITRPPSVIKEPKMSDKERLKLKEAFQVETVPGVSEGHHKTKNPKSGGHGGDFCFDAIVFIGDCFLCHGERS